jgi:hypothetical protein
MVRLVIALLFLASLGAMQTPDSLAQDASPVPSVDCREALSLESTAAVCVRLIHVAVGAPAFEPSLSGRSPCPDEGTPDVGTGDCGFAMEPPLLDFGQQTDFLPVPSGQFTLTLVPMDGNGPPLEQFFQIEPGSAVEIYALGIPGALEIEALVTDLSPIPGGTDARHLPGTRVRVLNAHYDGPAVDVVEVTGDIASRLGESLQPGDATGYQDLLAGKRLLMVQSANDGSLLWNDPAFEMAANTVYTLVVTISRSTGEVTVLPVSATLTPAIEATPAP